MPIPIYFNRQNCLDHISMRNLKFSGYQKHGEECQLTRWRIWRRKMTKEIRFQLYNINASYRSAVYCQQLIVFKCSLKFIYMLTWHQNNLVLCEKRMKNFGGVGYVHGIEGTDGFIGIYSPQTHQVVCINCVHL